MKFPQIVYLAFRNLMTHRSRSLLTTLGVVIGVGSILFLVSLGYGLQKLVTEEVVQLDAFYIIDVTAGDSSVIKVNQESRNKITNISQVKNIGANIDLAGKFKIGSSATDTVFYGVDKNYADTEKINIKEGNFISLADDSNEVIVSTAVFNLLGVKDIKSLLGQEISADLTVTKNLTDNNMPKTIPDVKLKVVGLIDDESVPFAYIPITVAQKIGAINYTTLKVRINDKDEIDVVRKTIENMGFKTEHIEDTLSQINQIFSILQIGLGAVGFVAMVVALLGMFNTLTISLLERMKEVGYLKVIGARNRDVFLLFVSESVLIGVMGGVIGIGGSIILELLLNLFISGMAVRSGSFAIEVFYTPYYFAAVMLIFSIIVGFLTGLYPARRAVRVKPLDVLRYE